MVDGIESLGQVKVEACNMFVVFQVGDNVVDNLYECLDGGVVFSETELIFV